MFKHIGEFLKDYQNLFKKEEPESDRCERLSDGFGCGSCEHERYCPELKRSNDKCFVELAALKG